MSTINDESNSFESPVELSEDEVNLAMSGKSKEVLEPKLLEKGPVKLSIEEVRLAQDGKSEDVMKKHRKKANY
jgi:hypothetical protein